MKHIYTIVLFILFSTSQLYGAQQGKHLFILSGQSNMVLLNTKSSFTPTLAKFFGKNNIIVVKDAEGAQPIRRWCKKWRPLPGEAKDVAGDLYDRLMRKVKAAIQGKQIVTVTVIWMQGESDAKEKLGNVYMARLKGLIDQFRSDFGKIDINFVIGRLNDFDLKNKRFKHWTLVREAQVKVADTDQHVSWIDTDDLNEGLRKGRQVKNNLHCSVEGIQKLGVRFAEKAIEMIQSNHH